MPDTALAEKMLLVLAEHQGPLAPVDLLLAAWREFPADFGLPGTDSQHPDARYLAVLGRMRDEWVRGESGVVVLTAEGRQAAEALRQGRELQRPILPTAEETNKRFLERLRPRRPVHRWQQYADLIEECGGIMDASARGFTVNMGDGERTVEFHTGLTPELYYYLAPFLSEPLDQVALARGVIANALSPTPYLEFSWAWNEWCKQHGGDEDEWLPDAVEAEGFSALVEEVKIILRDDARHHKPAAVPVVTVAVEEQDAYLVLNDQPRVPIRKNYQPVLASFATKILAGNPRAVVPWKALEELLPKSRKRTGSRRDEDALPAIAQPPANPESASEALRQWYGRLNAWLARELDSKPPGGEEWLKVVKGEGLQLNPSVTWQATEGTRRLLASGYVHASSQDGRLLEEMIPDRGQKLPARSRRQRPHGED